MNRRTQILQAAGRRIARDGVRGLRVNDVADEAGVSPGLLYYHFTDRAGLLEATLEHINTHAREVRSAGKDEQRSAFEELEQQLLGELDEELRDNSAAWGELSALAVFEENLRQSLARTTATWIEEIARAVAAVHTENERPETQATDPTRTAAILTALVDGLSNRWLTGELTLQEARSLLSEATGRLVHANHDDRATPTLAAD